MMTQIMRFLMILMVFWTIGISFAQNSAPQPQITPPQTASAPDGAPQTTPIPTTPTNTLLTQIQPSESALQTANTELLAKNAELSRQVDDLTTQVQVLVQERSGQLFMYGAMTALFSLLLGAILARIFIKQRW